MIMDVFLDLCHFLSKTSIPSTKSDFHDSITSIKSITIKSDFYRQYRAMWRAVSNSCRDSTKPFWPGSASNNQPVSESVDVRDIQPRSLTGETNVAAAMDGDAASFPPTTAELKADRDGVVANLKFG
jgi:hypothetical protein